MMLLNEYISNMEQNHWDKRVRDYQLEAMQSISIAKENGHDSTLLVLPTGSGKTFTTMVWLCYHMRVSNVKVLWMVHREELLEQAVDALLETDRDIGFSRWTADRKNVDGQIIFAMMLSARNAQAIHTLSRDIVVVDEGHMLHTGCSTYQRLLNNRIDYKFLLGITATPLSPKKELDVTFDNICYQITFVELVKRRYLARPQYIRYRTDIEWEPSKMKDTLDGKEFDDADLRALNRMDRNKMIVNEYKDNRSKYGKTVVFAIDVNHAMQLREEFVNAGVRTDLVVGDMPKSLRRDGLRKLREGETEVMINVMVLIEGWDEPTINTVFLARPTHSERLYMQMIGRGSRIIKNEETGAFIKNSFFIVDFIDNCHKYALAADEWSIKHFEAREDETLREVKDRAERKSLVNRLAVRIREEHGMKLSDTRRIERELLNIVGVLTTSNFTKKVRDRKLVITKRQKMALDKLLNIMLQLNSTKDRPRFETMVDSTYYDCVTRGRWAEFNFMQWRSIAWSMYTRYVMGRTEIEGSNTYRFTEVSI